MKGPLNNKRLVEEENQVRYIVQNDLPSKDIMCDFVSLC